MLSRLVRSQIPGGHHSTQKNEHHTPTVPHGETARARHFEEHATLHASVFQPVPPGTLADRPLSRFCRTRPVSRPTSRFFS